MLKFFAFVLLLGWIVPISIARTLDSIFNLTAFYISPVFSFVIFIPSVLLIFFGTCELLVTGKSKLHPELYSKKIVTRGVYSKIRHPIYLGFAGTFLAIATFFGSWFMSIFFFAFIPVMHFQADREEKELTKKFGKAYVNYTERVPRWIPRFR